MTGGIFVTLIREGQRKDDLGSGHFEGFVDIFAFRKLDWQLELRSDTWNCALCVQSNWEVNCYSYLAVATKESV